ncbi:MAG TPA: hypothetical protein PKD72_09640, partial [Gemmatales bacterium]|nr:hypothetical protein [Gemmatales bacterium]
MVRIGYLPWIHPAKLPRRHFLASMVSGSTAIGSSALLNGVTSTPLHGQTTPASVVPVSYTQPPFRLGMVTYNLCAEWDLPTILKICQETGIAAVELRTTHKHGVEPTLSAEQRREVRNRFAASGIVPWGLG